MPPPDMTREEQLETACGLVRALYAEGALEVECEITRGGTLRVKATKGTAPTTGKLRAR